MTCVCIYKVDVQRVDFELQRVLKLHGFENHGFLKDLKRFELCGILNNTDFARPKKSYSSRTLCIISKEYASHVKVDFLTDDAVILGQEKF